MSGQSSSATRARAERLVQLDMGNTPWATPKQYLELLDVVRDLSLCLDEHGQHQGTHYIRDGKIEPKGSFIALVQKAQEIMERTDG